MDVEITSKQEHVVVAVLVLSVFVGALTISGDEETSFASELNSNGMTILNDTKKTYMVRDRTTDQIAGIEVTELAAGSNQTRVELRILSDVQKGFAFNWLQDRRNEIVSMYTDTPSPYAAVPRREINCPAKYLPNKTVETIEGINYTYYSIYTDEDYNLGVCSDENSFYKVKLANFYCSDSENVVEVREYHGINETAAVVDGIRCSR